MKTWYKLFVKIEIEIRNWWQWKNTCEQNIMWSMKTIIICGMDICGWTTLVFDSSKKSQSVVLKTNFTWIKLFWPISFVIRKTFCLQFFKIKNHNSILLLFSILLCNMTIKNSNQFEFLLFQNSCQDPAHAFQKNVLRNFLRNIEINSKKKNMFVIFELSKRINNIEQTIFVCKIKRKQYYISMDAWSHNAYSFWIHFAERNLLKEPESK